MSNQITLSNIKGHLESMRDDAQQQLDTWKAKFEKNPVFAMEWADGTYLYAARLALALDFMDYVDDALDRGRDDEEAVKAITKQAMRRLMNRATENPNRSSSTSTNLLEAAKTQALAKFVEFLQD